MHPVSRRACGQQLHLAGFAYPVSGVARVTAVLRRASSRRPPGRSVPASLFRGAACLRRSRPRAAGPAPGPGGLGARRRHAAGHGIRATSASGTGSGAGRWRVTVSLGAAGECFAGPRSAPAPTAAAAPASRSGCRRPRPCCAPCSSRPAVGPGRLRRPGQPAGRHRDGDPVQRHVRADHPGHRGRPRLRSPGPAARQHADPADPARPFRARVRHRDVHPPPAERPAAAADPRAGREIRSPQRGLRGLSSVV